MRHAEATSNEATKKFGEEAYESWEYEDARLTEVGYKQCERTKEYMKSAMKPELVIVSPLSRAIQTATEIFSKDKATLPFICYGTSFIVFLANVILFKNGNARQMQGKVGLPSLRQEKTQERS